MKPFPRSPQSVSDLAIFIALDEYSKPGQFLIDQTTDIGIGTFSHKSIGNERTLLPSKPMYLANFTEAVKSVVAYQLPTYVGKQADMTTCWYLDWDPANY